MKKLIKILLAVAASAAVLSSSGCDFPSSGYSETSTDENSPSSGESSEQASEENADEKVYTVDEFCELFNAEKNFALNHSKEEFTVTGTLTGENKVRYSSIEFRSTIVSEKYHSEFLLTCDFDDKSVLGDIEEGDIVTVKGKLFSIATSGIILNNCTIENIEKAEESETESSDSAAEPEKEPDYQRAMDMFEAYCAFTDYVVIHIEPRTINGEIYSWNLIDVTVDDVWYQSEEYQKERFCAEVETYVRETLISSNIIKSDKTIGLYFYDSYGKNLAESKLLVGGFKILA